MANSLHPDPLYVEPFVDVDEWRATPDRHRYVHGGFADTDLRFSVYLPPEDRYDGRFFQPLMHIAGQETVAPSGDLAGMGTSTLPFAFASGGYVVESNQGSTQMMGPPDITGFRASAATAQYARILAAEMYGGHRPHGYVFGGSGGAFKTMACVENTVGVWDGSVPFIHGSPMAMPHVFTVQSHAMRVLDGMFDQIVDALEPGGSGDPHAVLNDEQRAAFAEITRMGFPPRAWFAHERIAASYTGVFAAIFGTLAAGDPTYFADFWRLPGYLGADPPPSLLAARVWHTTTVAEIVTTAEMRRRGLPVSIAAGTQDSAPAAFRLAELPAARIQGALLTPRAGPAAGRRLMVTAVVDDLVTLGFGGADIAALEQIGVGDEVEIDNSDYLAAQTYHRHQNPPGEYRVWEQFRDDDGSPLYPQRPLIQGYDQVGEGNHFQTGRFDGRMITVNCLMDEAAYPWQADWYRRRVEANLGPDIDDRYRLWFVDRAMHTNPSRYLSPTEGHRIDEGHGPTDTHIVSYTGVLQQALRDLAAWVEAGVDPPSGTTYRVDDGQVHVTGSAAQRGGVQPVVDLTVNGADRADVAVDEPVQLVGVIDVPPDAGVLVAAEWDDDGTGTYADGVAFGGQSTAETVTRTVSFAEPGTHFVTLRVTAQRVESIGEPFGRAHHLDRVRVVVTERTDPT